MIVLIVTRKRGNGRYYFALRQTNNKTPNTMLLSESAVSSARHEKDGTWSELT
jgi:hypothetical protein